MESIQKFAHTLKTLFDGMQVMAFTEYDILPYCIPLDSTRQERKQEQRIESSNQSRFLNNVDSTLLSPYDGERQNPWYG